MAALYIVTWLQTKNYGLDGTAVVCDLASAEHLDDQFEFLRVKLSNGAQYNMKILLF